MPKSAQAGIAQVVVLVLLLGGVIAGTYLVQQRTNLFPKAFQLKKGYLSGSTCTWNSLV